MKVNTKFFKALGALLVAVLLFAALPAGEAMSQATTHYVDDDAGCGGQLPCYTSIQAAIDAAIAGDTINVAEGTYTITTAIDVNKGVTIIGDASNPENVVVQYSPASETQAIFDMNAADITVQGITAKDGKNGFLWGRTDINYTGCTVTDCVVENASSFAIGEIPATGTVISNNTIDTCGDKGIYIRICDATSVAEGAKVTGNTISGCKQAAIQVYDSPYTYVYKNTIDKCEDKGINVMRTGTTTSEDSGVQVIENTISECKFPGIQSIGAPYTYIYNNTLSQCNYYGGDGTPDFDYGSIFVADDTNDDGSYVVVDSNNVSDGGNGVVIWSDNCDVTDNTIYDMGLTYLDSKPQVGNDGPWYNSAIVIGGLYETDPNDPSGTTITGNNIHDNYWGLQHDSRRTNNVTAEDNWWGSILGPAGQVVGDVDYDPWCGDAECSFTVSATEGNGDFYVNAAGQLVISGTVNVPGGITINEPGVTILLLNETVIQNNSPCFTINASNTIIKAESIGGATCVPTDDSNGINVAADLDQIEILNMVIDGTGQDTGDGIHFAGAISNLWIVNNKIQNLDGDGIKFTAEPTGDVQIQGNLFMNNTGNGIEAGTHAIPAQYNSWGHVNGAVDGDGASDNVTWTNWTHAALSLESTGTVYANQVVQGDQITYEVYGDFANIMGAEFTLHYPDELVYVNGSFTGGLFDFEEVDTSEAGKITFGGSQKAIDGTPPSPPSPALSGTHKIFSVRFTGDSLGKDKLLSFSDENFSFAHAAGEGGPTNHVYAAGLTGVDDLEVIDLPTLSHNSLDEDFVAGLEKTFDVTTDNPAGGGEFTNVLVNFRLKDTLMADIYSFQCYDSTLTEWLNMPLSQDDADVIGYWGPQPGFPIGAPYNATTGCRAVFMEPGSYDVEITLDDLVEDWELAKLTQTVTVLGDFTVTGTVTMQGRLDREGVPMTMTIQTLPEYGPFQEDSSTAMIDNLSFTGVNGGTYLVTTNQPRFLNVHDGLAEVLYVDGNEILPALHLLGGNADWVDNYVIDISDASIVGSAYGNITVNENGDVNFDGRVNIQDLALVGGNYNLTSAEYDGWLTP